MYPWFSIQLFPISTRFWFIPLVNGGCPRRFCPRFVRGIIANWSCQGFKGACLFCRFPKKGCWADPYQVDLVLGFKMGQLDRLQFIPERHIATFGPSGLNECMNLHFLPVLSSNLHQPELEKKLQSCSELLALVCWLWLEGTSDNVGWRVSLLWLDATLSWLGWSNMPLWRERQLEFSIPPLQFSVSTLRFSVSTTNIRRSKSKIN